MSSSSSTSTTAAGFAFAAGADCLVGITLTAPAGIFLAGREATGDGTAGSAETDITGKLLGMPLVGCETTFFAPPPPPPKSGGGSGKSTHET